MFSEILSRVLTTSDRLSLIRDIDLLLDSMYKLGDAAFEPTLSHDIDTQTADLIRKLFEDSKQDKTEVLKQLKAAVMNLGELRIEVAYIPSESSIQQIYDWIAKNTSRGFVISFNVDPKLIAGANVSNGGKFFSGSMREQIIEHIDNYNGK